MRRATVVRKTALVCSNTAANTAVGSPFNTSVGSMAVGAGMKVFLQVQPTDTIGRIRIRLVRAIAWRSNRSRHRRGRDGRLASEARANEIETAAGFKQKTDRRLGLSCSNHFVHNWLWPQVTPAFSLELHQSHDA